MNLLTAVVILNQQVSQLMQLSSSLESLATVANSIINEENSIAEINPQIHSLTATMNIMMTSISSQDVIIQQAIDKVAELSA